MPVMRQKFRQYGYSAFAKHCAALGVSFDECYHTIFGRYPTKYPNLDLDI